MMQLVLRRYRPGDEEPIAGLLRKCFDTYNRFGLTGDKWLEYARIDPGFSTELSYVAELGGKVVSHVQIVERKLRTTLGVVKAAGVANVSTDPEHRGRGLATNLLKKALSDCGDAGYALSALFTGYASRPQRIYRRLRFTDVELSRRFRALLSDVRPPSLGRVEVVEEDEPPRAVYEVYEERGDSFAGWPVRSEQEWREKVAKRVFIHSFFYVDKHEGLVTVAREGGDVVGYAVGAPSPWDEESFLAVELVSVRDRPTALAALLGELVKRAAGTGRRVIVVDAPPTPEYRWALRGAAYEQGLGVFMVKLLGLRALFSHVREDLEARISKKPVAKIGIRLTVEGESVTLRVGEGELEITGDSADAEVYMPASVFNKLLFGVLSPAEALMDSKVKCNVSLRRLVESLEAIFTPRKFHIWAPDRW